MLLAFLAISRPCYPCFLTPSLSHLASPHTAAANICWYDFSGRSTFKASNLDIYYYLWWFEFTWSHFTCTALGNKFLTLIIHKVRDSQKMQAVWKGPTEISKTILNGHFEGEAIYVFTMSRNKLYDGGYWSKLARSDLVHLRLDDFKVAVKFWAPTHPPQKKTWFTIVSGG